jgi:SAM-dependent methyltransferase
MDYGFVFPAAIHIHKDVAYAEQHGFTHAWLYDSQMLFSDPYASLSLCAVNTSKIALGTGVTNPASRIAPVTANSEFVDLGSGLGRVAMLVHLLTGARTHGIELQAHLVQQAHSLSAGLSGVTFTAGDATEIELDGSTFFLYAPFSGDMLQRALARLHEVAQKRTIVIGAVGFEFQDVSWLQPRTTSVPTLTVYVSVSCASVS